RRRATPGRVYGRTDLVADLVRANETALRRANAGGGALTEYLSFRLGDELFALPLRNVQELIAFRPLTYVPRAPDDVVGILFVRGLLVTVIDLRRRLRLSFGDDRQRGRVLLVPGPEGETLGLLVDEVEQVYRLAESEVEQAANVLGGNTAEYVAGIGRRDDKVIVLLSLGPLLTAGR
ncbi:MAG TPA: chemotaxis protein CheW, partial [Polyangiaceae bacterium]|nr:chemotaxis protein CheW [Polyangiaceae bacterium]